MALKTSFLLGGRPDDPEYAPQLDQILHSARTHRLVVHIHTSAGASFDIDQVGQLVDKYGDDIEIHLVHMGGGVSGHIKLISQRFFDWIQASKAGIRGHQLGDRFRSSLAGQRDRAPR